MGAVGEDVEHVAVAAHGAMRGLVAQLDAEVIAVLGHQAQYARLIVRAGRQVEQPVGRAVGYLDAVGLGRQRGGVFVGE